MLRYQQLLEGEHYSVMPTEKRLGSQLGLLGRNEDKWQVPIGAMMFERREILPELDGLHMGLPQAHFSLLVSGIRILGWV